MTHEPETMMLTAADGRQYACRPLGIVEYAGRDYALVLSGRGDDERLIILRREIRGDEHLFMTIGSDEEFERVASHVRALARAQA